MPRASREPVATVQGGQYPLLEPSSPNEAGVECLKQTPRSIVSKVQVSPRWLQKTFSISNGTPPKRSATGEGFGIAWPGEDLAILAFAALFLIAALAAVALTRRSRIGASPT